MCFIKFAEMSKKDIECDIGWKHSKMLSVWHHWRCKWCSIEFKGVTRLNQHLTGGYPDVVMCQKCPQKVRHLMKKHFTNSKAAKEKAKQKRTKVDRRVAKPPYHSRKSEAFASNDKAQMEAAIQVSLDDQYWLKKMVRHREWFGPLHYELRSDFDCWEESEFKRTTSIREPVNRGKNTISSMLEAFGSKRRSSRDIPTRAIIHDLDL